MARDVVVLFARAPRLGTVKRRLARGVGERAALRFHCATFAAVSRRLARDRRFDLVVSVAGPARGPWLRRLAHEDQGSGDLGQRMQRAFDRRPHRRVVIVGSDIPDLRASDVAAAFRALGRAPAVLGPASDGGYWLVGFDVRRRPGAFAAVRWSSAHALADTARNLGRVAYLRLLDDVDEAADLSVPGASA